MTFLHYGINRDTPVALDGAYARGVKDAHFHVATFGTLPAFSLADFERRHGAYRGSQEYIAGLTALLAGVDLSWERTV